MKDSVTPAPKPQATSRTCRPIDGTPWHDLVPDDELRALAKGEPGWIYGELSHDMQQKIIMLLPDLCGELLAHRLWARADAQAAPRNDAEEIARARQTAERDAFAASLIDHLINENDERGALLRESQQTLRLLTARLGGA
ncbi:MAG: hypothetical protein AAF092_05250 [Pseudomonadota bacterium]